MKNFLSVNYLQKRGLVKMRWFFDESHKNNIFFVHFRGKKRIIMLHLMHTQERDSPLGNVFAINPFVAAFDIPLSHNFHLNVCF